MSKSKIILRCECSILIGRRLKEVAPTGRWKLVKINDLSHLFLEVSYCSVLKLEDIDPFWAHEERLTLTVLTETINECVCELDEEVQDEQL